MFPLTLTPDAERSIPIARPHPVYPRAAASRRGSMLPRKDTARFLGRLVQCQEHRIQEPALTNRSQSILVTPPSKDSIQAIARVPLSVELGVIPRLRGSCPPVREGDHAGYLLLGSILSYSPWQRPRRQDPWARHQAPDSTFPYSWTSIPHARCHRGELTADTRRFTGPASPVIAQAALFPGVGRMGTGGARAKRST